MAIPTIKTILQGGSGLEEKYIEDFEVLGKVVQQLRDAGFSIVLTMGVYDMFHVGHKRYLEEASKHGDVLIVGVDSDELTREMKGHIDPNRPFDQFEARVELLAALSFIKIVTRRHNDRHIDDLIKTVRPDILVISKTTTTFTPEKVREIEEYCGRIEHLEAKADPKAVSTTAKLKRLRAEGAQELARNITQAVQKFLGEDGNEPT